MINSSLLSDLGVRKIVACAQVSPKEENVLFGAGKKQGERIPSLHNISQLIVDVTAETLKKMMYIGGLDGFIWRYLPSYDGDSPLTAEALALMHGDPCVVEFAYGVFNEKGILPRQWSTNCEWCREGGYLAIVTSIDIRDEYQNTGIIAELIKTLHIVIQNDCCIPVESLFLSESVLKPYGNLPFVLRGQGFSRIGSGGICYLARHVPE